MSEGFKPVLINDAEAFTKCLPTILNFSTGTVTVATREVINLTDSGVFPAQEIIQINPPADGNGSYISVKRDCSITISGSTARGSTVAADVFNLLFQDVIAGTTWQFNGQEADLALQEFPIGAALHQFSFTIPVTVGRGVYLAWAAGNTSGNNTTVLTITALAPDL